MSYNPYAERIPVNRRMPESGRSPGEIAAELRGIADEENGYWEGGQVSGSMYCGDHEHYAFLTDLIWYRFKYRSHRTQCLNWTIRTNRTNRSNWQYRPNW